MTGAQLYPLLLVSSPKLIERTTAFYLSEKKDKKLSIMVMKNYKFEMLKIALILTFDCKKTCFFC